MLVPCYITFVPEGTNPMSTKITLELTPDEAWWMKAFCVDAAIVWHELWQDAAEGRRPDLDAASCKRLNRRAHEYAERIQELMPED